MGTRERRTQRIKVHIFQISEIENGVKREVET